MSRHFEFLIEEPSMEAFLSGLLPRILADRATYGLHVHRGKIDLLRKLDGRLRGYARFIDANTRIFVIVDRDDDDCLALKQRMERICLDAGLRSRAMAGAAWQMVNRIAVEELEAWFFGEWGSVRQVYPKVPRNLPNKAGRRLPDEIPGGTWETLERIFKRSGYFSGGLRKVECARALGAVIDPKACTSPSFACFHRALIEALPPIRTA